MNQFMKDHPWLSFFLAIAAIDGVVSIVRGRPSVPASLADAFILKKTNTAPGGLTPPKA